MRSNHCIVVFVFCVAACRCGVIERGLATECQEREKREAAGQPEGAVSYGGRQEVGVGVPGRSSPVHDPDAATAADSLELPSIKQKRCPSMQSRFGSNHDFISNHILGAKTPLLDIQRRDIQSNMTKRFCNVCKARPQCKLYNKCDQCKRWCIDEDFPSNKTNDNSSSSTPETNDIPHAQTSNGISAASSEESNEVKMTLLNRLGSTSTENQETEDTKLSLPTPGGFKRIFTIANFSSGPLKELICNLLGISDTTDIDKMVVWVTTFSNKQPKFAQGYKKNVTPKMEKLTDALNEELKKTMAQNKKQGRNYLTNEEMEDMARKILVAQQGDVPAIEKLLPNYPIYKGTFPKVNPDVIQDTIDPKLLDNSKYYNDFPTRPRFGSTNEESTDTSEEVTVAKSAAEQDPLKQMQSAPVQDTNSPNLPNEDASSIISSGNDQLKTDKLGMKNLQQSADKSDSRTGATQLSESEKENEIPMTLDKKEPSRLVTKKLMQQVKELMKQKTKYSGQIHQDANNVKPEDSKLGNAEHLGDKLSHLEENSENIDPPLQTMRPKEEIQDYATDLKVTKGEPSVVKQNILKKIQDMQSERSDSKPGGSVVTSSILEDGTLKNEEPKSKSIEALTTTTNLQDDLSKSFLKNTKQDFPEFQKPINDFDTAKAALKDLENMVQAIKKQTNTEQAMDQIVAMADDVRKTLKPSDVVQKPPNFPKLHPTESILEKIDKNRPQSILNRILQKKLYDKDKLGLPKLKLDEPGSEKVGSQPIEQVIWDKQLDPRMFQHVNQRKDKDKLRFGSPRIDDVLSSPVKEKETQRELTNDVPDQKMAVDGKEVPLKQKPTVNISPSTGTEETVGGASPKLDTEGIDSTSETKETFGSSKTPLQMTVDGSYLENKDDIPEKMDGRLKNIDALSSSRNPLQKILDRVSKYNTLERTDIRSGNNEPLGLSKTLSQKTVSAIDTLGLGRDLLPKIVDGSSKYNDNIPEGMDTVFRNKEPLGSSKTPSLETVNDIASSNDNLPEGMDSRVKNIGTLGSSRDPSPKMLGSAFKLNDNISEGMDTRSRDKEPLGLSKIPSQERVGDTYSINIDNGLKNMDPLGSSKDPRQKIVGSSLNNDKISKEIDGISRNNEPSGSSRVPSQGIVGSTGKYNDNIPGGIDSRYTNTEDLDLSKTAASSVSEQSSMVGNNLEESRWSTSLGTLMPIKSEYTSTPISPKDMYFIGHGIKLPLQMIHNDNGTVHLSVDLDKLCSCKNNTVCPKNHTSGSVLEKQTVAENNLNTGNDMGGFDFGMSIAKSSDESQKISSSTTNRNEREITSKWLDIKNSIARQLDPNEQHIQREDINVFKRSTEKTTPTPEKITMPIAESTDVEKDQTGNFNLKNPELKDAESNGGRDNLNTLQEFLNKKFMILKAKMMDVERKNEIKFQHSEEKMMDTINAISRNPKPGTKTNEIENVMAYFTKERPMEKTEATEMNKSRISRKPFELKSRFKENLSSRERGNELIDRMTPVKGVYKFKTAENLQNILEKSSEYIDQYSQWNKNSLQKETDTVRDTRKDSFIKKEVDIMTNVLRFLKSLATDTK